MTSTLPPPPPAAAAPAPASAPAPAATSTPADTASSLTTAASSETDQARSRSQKTRSNSTKDKSQSQANATKEIKKDGNSNRSKREKKTDGASAAPATSADADASSAAPAAPKQQTAAKRRGSRASKHANQAPQPQPQAETAHASSPVSLSTSPNDPSVPPKRQPKSTGRNSTKKQGKASESTAKDTVENSTDGVAAGALVTPSPKRGEKLSTSTDGNSNHTNSSNNNNNNNNTVDGSSVRKKSKKKSKEPTGKDAAPTADSNASEAGGAHGKRQKDKGPKDTATAGKSKAGNSTRSQGGRQSNKGGHQAGAGSSAIANDKLKEKVSAAASSASSRDVRPSSISSSCSFVTSSSSLSPTSPTSPSSSSSSPTSPATPSTFGFNPVAADKVNFAAGTGAAVAPATKESLRDRSEVTRIRTNVAGDFPSSTSAPLSAGAFSPLSQTSPSSRRSSTLTPLGDKLGRLGGGLPTVEENTSERHFGQGVVEAHPGVQPSSGTVKRGHTRSLSMKEQLAALDQQKKSSEGKTLESLQEIISSLKSLPPTAAAVSGHTVQGDHTLGATRHEKRLSLSSLSGSRNSVGPLGGASSSTTLHISQPPRGTTIESALQSTVATLRRLSVSDSKRPLVPLKEHEAEATAGSNERTGNRRSAVFARNAPSAATDSIDQRRISTSAGYQPNRRSVIVKPEEVAALQEGRPYVPSAFSFSSDDEPDAVADALSALEGKGSTSNRSSYSANMHHQQSTSSVDANSLAEFAARLPSHMKPVGAAALVNNDDAQDRRRFTTAFHSMGLGANRASVLAPAGAAGTLGKRLSTLPSPSSREVDRKDWRMSTPTASNNRDSVSFKDGANGRRPLFMAHLTYSDFHSLLTKQKHKYVQGVLRINKRNRSDAYVTVDSLPEGDVYICGSKDRNRALEGDVVGIELIDQEEQSQQRMDSQKDKKHNKNGDGEETAEADVDEIKPKYCGRIVSIVERSISQMFSGTLTLQRPSGSTKKNERRKDDDDQKGQPRIVWFKPTDKRVPLIAIPIDQAPGDFIDNHASYAHKLFVASIKRWPLSSLHPFGQLERELGDIGNIEIETEALLADNNVTTTAFGEKVEKCLPDLPWAIPEKELSRRRDLRQDCIFTIDPATAKDLDDAVSCTRLDDGTYEIGVHIADVSHFIKVGSALDREAKSRATTVYLVQKAIPMLPNVLCEDLCSLTANVDRLAFSVFWKMTEDGHVLGTTFSKSVIRSCAQLSYDDAQRVITTGSLDPKVEVHGQPRTLVEENIKVFFKLSQILRQNRFENGSLSINSIKLSFATDEIHNPLDVSVYELKESNRLIEEFMLLANMSVAKQICEFFPEQALLRRHEDPLEKRMADFISHMNKIGLDLDASSSGALQQSLDAIQDPDVRKVVRLLVIKPMQRAKYICSGMLNPDKFHHYALNSPLYTHFTSPIRRYADIIVHRMLEASLVGDSKFYLSKESCQKSANHCNIKKDAAKLAQEQSSHVYLSVLLRNMTESKGRVVKDAIVVQVLDSAFDVLVPEYGLEKRVYVDQLPLERHSWNESTETLKLYWTTDAFKIATEDDGNQDATFDNKNRRLSALPGTDIGLGAMDHPDDVTNAYDDERGLFEDESDDDSRDGLDAHSTLTSVPEDEDEGEDEARRLNRIRIFGPVQVLITADTTISPPVIKVVAMNPFAANAELEPSSAAVAV